MGNSIEPPCPKSSLTGSGSFGLIFAGWTFGLWTFGLVEFGTLHSFRLLLLGFFQIENALHNRGGRRLAWRRNDDGRSWSCAD